MEVLTSTACTEEKKVTVVYTAACSAGGVYCRAQYPVRHLAAERTDSDQVSAVRLKPKARMTNRN